MALSLGELEARLQQTGVAGMHVCDALTAQLQQAQHTQQAPAADASNTDPSQQISVATQQDQVPVTQTQELPGLRHNQQALPAFCGRAAPVRVSREQLEGKQPMLAEYLLTGNGRVVEVPDQLWSSVKEYTLRFNMTDVCGVMHRTKMSACLQVEQRMILLNARNVCCLCSLCRPHGSRPPGHSCSGHRVR